MKNLQQKLFGGILILLFLPMLQAKFEFVIIGDLGGYETPPEYSKGSMETWLDASYQTKADNYLKRIFGFRNWAVRLHKQSIYSLYGETKNIATVVGKEGYLFDREYIKEYYGQKNIQKDIIEKKLNMLKQVQDTLQKQGKHLLVVIAPSKVDFFPEYLPDAPANLKKNPENNYYNFTQAFQKKGINHIDANKWFLGMKQNAPYPLFPQTGIHFTFYGAALFGDTIIRNIEHALQKDLPNIEWSDIEWSDIPQEEDDDLADAMNLITPLPNYKLPYPKIFINESGKYKPRAITIGDSFFWRFVTWGGLEKVYNQGQFWYYNTDIHPGKRSHADISFEQEIQKAEVICIVIAPTNLPQFAFNFETKIHKHFFGDIRSAEEKEALFQKKLKEARENKDWFEYIKKKAQDAGRPVEEVLLEEVRYVVEESHEYVR